MEALQPYLLHFVLIQAALTCLTLCIGLVILIQRLSRNAAEAPAVFDASTNLAAELAAEISRLGLQGSAAPAAGSASAVTSGGGASDGAATVATDPAAMSAVDAAAIRAQIEAEFEKERGALTAKVSELQGALVQAETTLAEVKKSASSAAANVEAASAAGGAGTDNAELAKVSAQLSEANDKVIYLEKVISEYRIFEEDFALVKKYKLENEKLKKQLSETHMVSEGDVAALFQSFDQELNDVLAKGSPAGGDQGDAKPVSDGASNAAVAAAAVSTADSDIDRLLSTSGAVSAVGEAVATLADEPAVDGPADLAKFLAESASDADDRLDLELANMAGKSSEAPKQESAGQSSATEESKVAGAENFTFEKVPEEPTIPRSASPEEDLESLAESAASDDKLLEEFEKILGEKNT